ncbi:MAG: 16S rRNA (guanine(966)-N(2))-methyltransferase RsmD [Betaproteobacteria bacterium]|nr:16S rRNA (guanine(966)-N(2))-methyltransferase RsmD [Betaproteobacteria bacterium]
MIANRVRIIGGQWRRRHLRFPELPDLRPTPDRVRETLFNWLGQDLSGWTCLDLFAGSGALSFEALSRHARLVVAVEKDRQALAALAQNAMTLQATGFELHAADALQFVGRERRRFDLIFLDPPFREELLPRLWLDLPRLLTQGGQVYIEAPAGLAPPSDWEVVRRGGAGKVHYHLLRHLGARQDRGST